MLKLVNTIRERLAVKQCPCGSHNNKDGKFVPFKSYINAGYCHSCGNTFYPDAEHVISKISVPQKPIYWIPGDHVLKTLAAYLSNNFTCWLEKTIGPDGFQNALSHYPIGTSKHWPGATIFWTIDKDCIPRRGTIMFYDKNGHRVKDKNQSVHALLKKADQKPPECFFGEHLLPYHPKKPIGIVESAKTAIIANHFLPEYVWLSCNGASGLTRQKFKVLAGRDVFLYPDEGKFEAWQELAHSYNDITKTRVSSLIEKMKDKPKGADLADLLVEIN